MWQQYIQIPAMDLAVQTAMLASSPVTVQMMGGGASSEQHLERLSPVMSMEQTYQPQP